jgi:plasmid stabilization system protein ParE
MSASIEYRPQARLDLLEFVSRHASDQLPSWSQAEYDSMLGTLEQFPQLFGIKFAGFRLAALRKAPFNVWYDYDADKDLISIARIVHQRSDPDALQKSLQ